MRYFLLFIGIAFTAFGPFWVIEANKFIATAKRSVTWPKIQGTIVQSAVVLSDSSYRPAVEYRYKVNETTHTGNSIHIGAAHGADAAWANSVTKRYPAGAAVEVAVDPTNPSISALETGTRWHMYMYLFSGTMITLLGAGLLYLVFTRWND